MTRTGKYGPLFDWFAALPATTNEVRLTFGKIEQVIGSTAFGSSTVVILERLFYRGRGTTCQGFDDGAQLRHEASNNAPCEGQDVDYVHVQLDCSVQFNA